VLFDSDRIEEAASVADEHQLLDSHLDLFLDPEDPQVREQAARDGIADDWIEAARRSPVYAMCKRWRIALPLHPEYRTLPMVWYVPPLSPVMDLVEPEGIEVEPERIFGAIEELRIPVTYLASFLAAGDPEPVRRSLRRLGAMRSYMRGQNLGLGANRGVADDVGMEPEELEEMFRMLAIGDYDERYVLPKRHGELSPEALAEQGSCGIDFAGPPAAVASSAEVGAEDLDLREMIVRRNGS
jgi:nitrate reductase beta subunit